MTVSRLVLGLVLASTLASCNSERSHPTPGGEQTISTQAGTASEFLFIWAGDADRKESDFLAVIGAKRGSRDYGRVVATLPIGSSGTMPHHTEYEYPPGHVLFANGWVAGRTFLLDLRNPRTPRLAGNLGPVGGYGFPHSFARLPNGHVLATFQSTGNAYAPPGGLVEMDETGALVRAASAVAPNIDPEMIWPYSLTIISAVDRAVVTTTPMGYPSWATMPSGSWQRERVDATMTRHVQVWSLSDLRLRTTLELPVSPQGKHYELPDEPRLLPDGSVYVNTFTCGLYRITRITEPEPSMEFVYSFPGGDSEHTFCGVPVLMGQYWIQPVGALPGLIALDIGDPARPVEASRLNLDTRFVMPHWMAADRQGNRLVLTGHLQSWVLVIDLDVRTGTLTIDRNFGGDDSGLPGVSFDRADWPHGRTGKADVHGALFRLK